MVVAFSKVNRGDGTNDSAVSESCPVEQLIPPRNSEILRQDVAGVDLRPGWTGVLIVNGVEIPEGQLDLDNLESLGQVLFTPGEDKAVEQYEAGENCVTAVGWRGGGSRADPRHGDRGFNSP